VNNSCRPPYYGLVLFVLFSALIAGLSGCSTGNSQALQTMKADAKEMPKNLWQDTKKLVMDRENAAILLIAGGASVIPAVPTMIKSRIISRATILSPAILLSESGLPAVR